MDAEAFDRLTAEHLKMMETPIQLLERSGDWISPQRARSLVMKQTGIYEIQAMAAICRRACHWVPVQVGTFRRGEEPHDYIDRKDFFSNDDKPRCSHFQPKPMPRDWYEVLHFFELISPETGDDADGAVELACWATGDFRVKLERDFSTVTMAVTGLSFDRPALLASFGGESSAGTNPDAGQAPALRQNGGGRPASRHGDVIAAVTLQLAKLPIAELRRYTAASLANSDTGELTLAYRKLGENPPNDRNRELFAAGILRVLRARET